MDHYSAVPAGGRTMTRLTLAQLEQIRSELTDRDKRLLVFLKNLRYMKTDQIRRVFFPPGTRSLHACKVATFKNLNRLKSLGLIGHLEKRIGGVRAGSKGMIWHITEAGARLLYLGTDLQNSRKRQLEPSPSFLRHTIAVTETFVQIVEICRDDPVMKLSRIEVEPECWRDYQKNGKAISLRPDLYAKTVTGEYFDHLFIEVDLDTESPTAIVEKCRRYLEYFQTGKEQKAYGVFPLVLWIAPDNNRKAKMKDAITQSFPNRFPHIFFVIIPDELETVIRDGVEKEKLC